MDKENQRRLAEAFRQRHRQKPVLLLPNAWDAMSARLFVKAGFEAIATTSGGVAWALGYGDGEQAPWSEVVAATARIVRVSPVPVTADIEAGYGASPAEVGAHVGEIIRAGVVGINLEDSIPHSTAPLRRIEDAAARIKAARATAEREGVPIVINARTDLYHKNEGEPAARFSETVARAKAYLAAGADCVYPFGLRELGIIAELAKAIGAPINITGRAGMPDAAELDRAGVARITIASAPTLVTMAAIRNLAEELRRTGRFDGLAAPIRHPDAQQLFALGRD